MATRVELRTIPVRDLVANRRNVREHLFDIDELANSIRANGLLQPLVVNDQGGLLVVTDGHRRLEACQRACVPAVPCLVTIGADARSVTTTMLAAAMHQELRPIEQARAFKALQDEGVAVADIARSTGYRVALIRARLLLLELPIEAQDMVDNDELTIGQATDLAKQVRSKKSGSASTRSSSRSSWLTRSHRLALSIVCDHGDARTVVGGVACGQCWEAAIRADERGELEVVPAHDEALVDRVLSGERLPMQRVDRLEGVRRLVAEGLSDSEVANRLNCTDRQVLRDRQALDLAATRPPGHQYATAVA
ncbi:ParB/RepB/Spo0J family partition protein [Intrasporangium flavum]|uniref:ParB/RepB/Spo0J family partition protein n=1 Tax=Intrasporangium flavum TaxID=1428657 RepID=UPI00096F30A3|nr:ParB/RepB/Spo0J family partition protein [Intrasporangium flavum]